MNNASVVDRNANSVIEELDFCGSPLGFDYAVEAAKQKVVDRNANSAIEDLKDWLVEHDFAVTKDSLLDEARESLAYIDYNYAECLEYLEQNPSAISREAEREVKSVYEALTYFIREDVDAVVYEWVSDVKDDLKEAEEYVDILAGHIELVGVENFDLEEADEIVINQGWDHTLHTNALEGLLEHWKEHRFYQWQMELCI
jgi:hypothetical protein